MEVYVLILAVIGIIFLIIPKDNFNKIGIPLILICFTLLFGLRNNLGLDDNTYMENFNLANDRGNLYIDQSYIDISRIMYKLHMNYKSVFLLYSIFTFLFMYIIVKKIKLDKKYMFIYVFSFICFCFFPYLTVMRQFLATMIWIYSILLLKEKKFIRSICLYLVAGYIHNSAFLLIIIMPLFFNKIEISKKIKIVLPILALVMSNTGILRIILIKLAEIGNISYVNYLLVESSNNLTNSGLLVYLMFLIYLFQCILKTEENDMDKLLEKGEMLFFTTFFITTSLGFVRRVSYYFMFFECFVFITFIKKVSNAKNRNTLIIIFLILQFAFIAYGMTNIVKKYDLSFNNFSINIFR